MSASEISGTQDRRSARMQLAWDLSQFFDRNHYAHAYLARRCRTTIDRIGEWTTGISIPTEGDWFYLRQVSRELAGSSWVTLRESARRELADRDAAAQIEDPIDQEPEQLIIDPGDPGIGEDLGSGEASGGAVADRTSGLIRVGSEKPGRDARVAGPRDLLNYTCKISRGRLVQIMLPAELSHADVRRIHAFLLTQVDDDDADPAHGTDGR